MTHLWQQSNNNANEWLNDLQNRIHEKRNHQIRPAPSRNHRQHPQPGVETFTNYERINIFHYYSSKRASPIAINKSPWHRHQPAVMSWWKSLDSIWSILTASDQRYLKCNQKKRSFKSHCRIERSLQTSYFSLWETLRTCVFASASLEQNEEHNLQKKGWVTAIRNSVPAKKGPENQHYFRNINQ